MTILLFGAGKIGKAIAFLLTTIGHYQVVLADRFFPGNELPEEEKRIKRVIVNSEDERALEQLFKTHHFNAIISSLPYFCNVPLAKKAREHNIHYFDLTEDVKTGEKIAEIAAGASSAFVPHCGLSPGFVNILAHHLIQTFDQVDC